MDYTLGSLFDGSGGFPLAGSLCGIEPKWAAEVEPYPIAVTRSRFDGKAETPLLKVLKANFPQMKLLMKHLGDISKVNGAEIEPVDIITFGSPCQDLSVAGKRAGLKHEANGDEETTRSGLFMEAVRIIKEMREATGGRFPTFALWENVPGAFSSNKGEDFRVVCEELIKIVEPSAAMPAVPQRGWAYADSYIGDGWSLAYRVFDAQYWGVPQRRRRIHLVLDLRGERAREVLFEREGVRGYFAQGRTPWQATPADAQGSTGADDRAGECTSRESDLGSGGRPAGGGTPGGDGRGLDAVVPYTLKIRSGCEGGGKGAQVQTDKSATLATNNDQYLFQPVIIENHPADSRVNIDDSGKVQTLTSRMGTGGGNVPMVMQPFCKSARARSADDATTWKEGKVANTLNTFDQGETRANELVVEPVYSMKSIARNGVPLVEQANPICASDYKDPDIVAVPAPVYCLQGSMVGRADKNGPQGDGVNEGVAFTENATDRHAVAYGLDRASFNQGQNAKFDFTILEQQQPTLTARGPGATCYVDTTHADDVVRVDEVTAPLQARDYKGGKLVQQQYIVRRLTPTECARLQGFADRWGDIDPKQSFTEEEYRFWMEVRNTHAAINGRKVQDYTEKQMLAWYNKLHTDSAEYKMWGNGIALPPALYCLQGMADALNAVETDDWML